MKHIYDIKAGILSLKTDEKRATLDRILTFACRENPKRHFILVNKLIGRYTPTSPKLMRQTYNQLAEKIGEGSQTYVVSFAEAATGLGAGVADSLAHTQNDDVYFQHTTRHKLDEKLWFTVDEEHSHAVNHMFYQPSENLLSFIVKSKRLVIVDDEITTGRTIKVLLLKILPYLPDLEEIVVTAIVDLMGEQNYLYELNLDIPIRYVSLLKANISLDKDPGFNPQLPKKVNSKISSALCANDTGRCGLLMPYKEKIKGIDTSQSTVVIADGEHQYIPFLLAERLENKGVEVVFQSINRSPILLCDAIVNKYKIITVENDTEHYLYNFFPENKSIFVVSEKNYEGLLFTEQVKYHEWKC
ncbi:phosphoribosyltransferase domain-containing protein [Pseudoalteromonas sp. SR44-5]|uniref:phosphoribosyltransferase domain-containing protein n=1 Tax=unclassified Pseudoalteromonas TaxID=194690 RepID=UPI0016005064|nr:MULTISPECIES: phosphoribosyltransferase domain-containing protein [unclassified Pseudoalteromonas]MBB1367643.1 phosphoribosyltransferase domain-containing protein [Pseudoalteromonas sp. SR44-5]MBB1418563.1 phosphoribosyltransferase domain-containing protein [Pseudoalteromonas sp. SG44-1]MBB1435477.1 phosphoribosyltransferase domain-containing protein [Pseudoalteromonas sp. SG43-6]